MAFFKPIYKKLSKLWYPQAITADKPVDMDELCEQIALISTVSKGDTKAALTALGQVMGTFMNAGRSVQVEGLGTFYYTCTSEGQGKATKEEVTAQCITGTRVHKGGGDRPVHHRHPRALRARKQPAGQHRHPWPDKRQRDVAQHRDPQQAGRHGHPGRDSRHRRGRRPGERRRRILRLIDLKKLKKRRTRGRADAFFLYFCGVSKTIMHYGKES